MEVLATSVVTALIVFNVGASHCPLEDANTVNVKGVLGENINMQCDIDPKICDKVLWTKKPSASHLNETGCDMGYCIRHTTDKSVLELPKISPDHCGSYECWCYQGRPEALLISCFELRAVCQMRVILPDGTLIHNGSISSNPEETKTIDTKLGDRHKIECQDGAEHFTTCNPLDDGSFTVTQYDEECWHLCSLPVNEIFETCDVHVSLRVQQPYGPMFVPESDDTPGVFRGKRLKRDLGITGSASISSIVPTSTSNPTSKSTSNMKTSPKTISGLTAEADLTTLAPPNVPSTAMGSPTQKSSTQSLTSPSNHSTSKSSTKSLMSPSNQSTSKSSTQSTTTTTTATQKTSTTSLKTPSKKGKQEGATLSTKIDPSSSSNKTSILGWISNDCSRLSIIVAAVSFVLSLLALMVAVSCCCYACFTFRHTGAAEITSEEAGKDDIALEGVTINAEDTEDTEKETQKHADESPPPGEQPPVTTFAGEATAGESPGTTETSAPQEPQKTGGDAMAGNEAVAENHVIDETTKAEKEESPKETKPEAPDVKETDVENGHAKDLESPEML